MDYQEKIGQMLEKIKAHEIKSTPAWVIKTKRTLRWILVMLCILLAVIAFSLVWIDVVFDSSLLFSLGAGRFVRHFLAIIPQFWLILLALSTAGGVYILRKTGHGYRYKHWIILCSLVGVILTFGFIAHGLRINSNIEGFMNRHPHPDFRDRVFPPREERWLMPDQGMLTGTIIAIGADDMHINTPRSDIWTVKYGETIKPFLSDFQPGQLVVIVGEETGESNFQGMFIRPLPTREPLPMGRNPGFQK